MSVMLRKTYGAPGPNTFGNVGDLRIDLTDNTVYRCARAITNCDDYGFVKVYQCKGVNTTYVWETVAAEDVLTYILVDEDGNQVPAVLVDRQTIFTATANDIREGAVAATSDGVTVGTKEIPAYYTTEGVQGVPAGSEFKITIATSNRYDYTKLQAIVCPLNTIPDDSVAAEKVCINDNVYVVGYTESIANITVDHDTKSINLNITNDTDKPFVIRYFTFKEEN